MPSERQLDPQDPGYIALDGEWLLTDLSQFSHTYNQVYSLCFFLTSADEQARFEHVLEAYPWRGGFSTVNFYRDLYVSLGLNRRPRIRSIEYASPGHIELTVIVTAALNLKHIVKQIVRSGEMVHDLYVKVRKGMQERKLLSVEIRERELRLKREEQTLSESDLKFLIENYHALSLALGIEGANRLLEGSKNPLLAMKVLLSLVRRTEKLASFEAAGKATF